MYIYLYMYICIHIYMYIYIYTNIHIYLIYTYIGRHRILVIFLIRLEFESVVRCLKNLDQDASDTRNKATHYTHELEFYWTYFS
jgi:hypothetical protein